MMVAWELYQAERFEEAVSKADEMIELDRNSAISYFERGNALEQLGRHADAISDLETGISLMGTDTLCTYALCFALVGAGRADEARRRVEDFVQRSHTTWVNPWFLAMAHVAIGELDIAFRYFEQCFAEHITWTIWFSTEPKLRGLHRDPRFLALRSRQGH